MRITVGGGYTELVFRYPDAHTRFLEWLEAEGLRDRCTALEVVGEGIVRATIVRTPLERDHETGRAVTDDVVVLVGSPPPVPPGLWY